ncbi:MAG: peptidoglycan DD-metalloendopeptidase family protein [Candidatus Kerfeldbacteria bacterium]|nr:peptidoglycan DD-metalloendopeptidase family protein [Candidatus Kerfeldbacteria bacterium]
MKTKSIFRQPIRLPQSLAVAAFALAMGLFAMWAAAQSPDQSTNINSDSNSNTNASADTIEIDTLNQQIEEKRKAIDELKRQTAIYERQLEQQQDQQASLESELFELNDSIKETGTKLELNTVEIESLQLQIQRVQRDIVAREKEIAAQQDELGTLLRRLYETDQVSHLELVVQEQTFSGFFARVQTLHALSESVRVALDRVVTVKKELETAKDDLDANRADLDAKRQELETARSLLGQQELYKTNLLEATKSSEQKYQELLSELRQQSAAVDTEITTLIDQVNQRLKDRGEDLSSLRPEQLAWPIDSSLGISAYFHDPTYPFRKVFEHPAIDIRAPHGTTVTASADGVVAIARKLDWIRDSKGNILWPAYNFITIVHGGNISTVYGHLSQVNVLEGQTVKRGQVIASSGGTPGTAGAGRLTTGPHLHFEVRLNGIPVNPLNYLPQ